MQNTVNISNTICKALKPKIEKNPEGLLGIQLGILAMYKIQHEKNLNEKTELIVKINLEEIASLRIGIQYTASSLVKHVNDGYMTRNWVMKTNSGHVRLINYANYKADSHEVIISFNSQHKDLLAPTRDKSIFTLEQLFRLGDTVTLLLYIYMVSLWNTIEHADKGYIRHVIDYNDFRQILGYERIENGRTEWHHFHKSHLKRAKGNINKLFPGTKIHYSANPCGQNHRYNTLTLEISGLKTEGIWGLEEVTIVNDNIPEFACNQKTLLTFLDNCIFQMYDNSNSTSEKDIPCRAEPNIAYIRETSIVSTKYSRCANTLKPAGYRPISIGNSKYLYNRLHLLGKRFGGADTLFNVITGTSSLNNQMTPFENQVAKYVLEHHGHVLYRVTPLYYGDEIICRKVQIEAYSLDDAGKSICINVKLLNAQEGFRINYMTGEVKKIY